MLFTLRTFTSLGMKVSDDDQLKYTAEDDPAKDILWGTYLANYGSNQPDVHDNYKCVCAENKDDQFYPIHVCDCDKKYSFVCQRKACIGGECTPTTIIL